MIFHSVYGVFSWGIGIPGKNLSICYCHAHLETKNFGSLMMYEIFLHDFGEDC